MQLTNAYRLDKNGKRIGNNLYENVYEDTAEKLYEEMIKISRDYENNGPYKQLKKENESLAKDYCKVKESLTESHKKYNQLLLTEQIISKRLSDLTQLRLVRLAIFLNEKIFSKVKLPHIKINWR